MTVQTFTNKCEIIIPNGTTLSINVRSDGYVNATQICNAFNKKFYFWKKNHTNQKILNEIKLKTGIDKLIDTITDNPNLDQGSFVHHELINLL